MQTLENIYQNFLDRTQTFFETTGKLLDNNPTLYKTVLIASHLFRAASMYGMMIWMPTSIPLTLGIMLGSSLLYRASIERFCCFRLTLPSFVGALAAWQGRALIMRAASVSSFAHLSATLSFAPLLCYTAYIIYLSDRDIENKYNPKCTSCSG